MIAGPAVARAQSTVATDTGQARVDRAAREWRLDLPALQGVRVPTYTRVDGLGVSFAPVLLTTDDRWVLEPSVTYRSHLGVVDPGLTASGRVGQWRIRAVGHRATHTNDGWARGDLVNSAVTLFDGGDARNYFRAWRATADVSREWTAGAWTFAPSVGVLVEEARSVGSPVPPAAAAWSFIFRSDTLGIRRSNPAVEKGGLASARAGIGAEWRPGASAARLDLVAETPWRTPSDGRFIQVVLDAAVDFPAFRDHTVATLLHVVRTVGDAAPPQRWHALGGGATLATLDAPLLTGDQLFYAATRYRVPLSGPEVPLVGRPEIALRYAVGAAGVNELPDLVQNVGLQFGFALLRAGAVVDPAEGDVRLDLSASLTP